MVTQVKSKAVADKNIILEMRRAGIGNQVVDHGISLAALRPEMRPKAMHSPKLPEPWYR